MDTPGHRAKPASDDWSGAWKYVDATARPLTPPSIRALLRQFGLRPLKQLGQNFLIDEDVLQRI
ncbi:MAG: 16S rRNA (adenine(1518)-N(6)/adenine(1519)-N(6))-dimethyltransferase, partial [Chloroflexi bacterium]|nr:16S rRNA (adenine(1518)-N(6)/adenine(1519)-N(6))-dimethyltransferase [Chloroflexota bacterium]